MTGQGRQSDRRVHAARFDGSEEIVRYDRAGKWRIEVAHDAPPREGYGVTVSNAAATARAWLERGIGDVFWGLPGGSTFDRLVDRA